MDNLFVFLMTFDYFQVPLEHQGRVLTWGIVGAILMRGNLCARTAWLCSMDTVARVVLTVLKHRHILACPVAQAVYGVL